MMASANTPSSGVYSFYYPTWKRKNLFPIAVVTILCSLSYFLGLLQHTPNHPTTNSFLPSELRCSPENTPTTTMTSTTLDFSAHHGAGESDVVASGDRTYPACDARYSEYTPCEDRERSLKYARERLVYRERHCPEEREVLKCLVPAPFGYRNPFPWPASRELAWFANVPHEELAVEKAVQNWIRVEGDMFRFPGGGTTFPRGADAYIDDMEKLIPLRDGSVRTALDTGCGVSLEFVLLQLNRAVETASSGSLDFFFGFLRKYSIIF